MLVAYVHALAHVLIIAVMLSRLQCRQLHQRKCIQACTRFPVTNVECGRFPVYLRLRTATLLSWDQTASGIITQQPGGLNRGKPGAGVSPPSVCPAAAHDCGDHMSMNPSEKA